ncbi:sulfite exporter TauE/SafE family protein [Thioalbus denitrificans]|nr:sulfite exporter TauE/SafE family protein [Thioalbus denitrificans]
MDGAAVSLSFGAALLLGLGFGAGPCNIACLPFLGPVFVAGGGGVRQAWRVLLPFSLGRLTGYAGVGLVAGLAGGIAQGWLESPVVRWVLGGATLLVAAGLLLRSSATGRKGHCAATGPGRKPDGQPIAVEMRLQRRAKPGPDKRLVPGGLYLMGMGMALNPCAPLSTIMLAAAAAASAVSGAWLGFGFGIGAVAMPAVIFGLGVAHLGAQLREHLASWETTLTRVSALMIAGLGTATALGWIQP